MSAKRKTNGAALVKVAAAAKTHPRLRVQKAYKMFVGGAFVRSESGRYLQVKDVAGDRAGEIENVARASRKDGRDAVKSAHAAAAGWAGRTAYNRGQILYRLGEVVEGRASELTTELHRSLGGTREAAVREVERTIDRVISFAGWSDKYQSLLASSNPVAGPHFNFTVPEPMGVVVIVAGNVCVVLASEDDPRSAMTFAECLATSDMPAGVVNLLTGKVAEVAPHLAKHAEVNALDLWVDDDALGSELEALAVDTVKRTRRHHVAPADLADEKHAGLRSIERFLELKTVWHPVGV